MGSEEEGLFHEMGARQGDSALLDADSIPNENQSLTCFSCEEQMRGLYCYACGNKNDNYRRSIWSLGIELFQSLTAFEGRIWRSLWSLIVKPGKMARQFADGARQRWTSPIRLFLATSLLLFGYITLSGTQLITLGSLQKSAEPAVAAISLNTDYELRLLFFVRKSELAEPPTNTANNPISPVIEGAGERWKDSDARDDLLDQIEDLKEEIEDAESPQAKMALEQTVRQLENLSDTLSLSLNASNNSPPAAAPTPPVTDNNEPNIQDIIGTDSTDFNITGIDGEKISLDGDGLNAVYQGIMKNPEIINNKLNSRLKLAMFFMMPFAMLMGAIFIRGRDKAMLYDHLVHAAYVHSFSFLLLFVFILLKQATSFSGLLIIYTIILLIYLPISSRNAFGRGWFKSFLTAYGVGAVYSFVMLLFSLGVIVSSLTDFAKEVNSRPKTIEMPTIEPPIIPEIKLPEPNKE